MATVTILRRATGKAHTISVLEADQAILGGLVRTSAGAGALYNDAFTTSATLGTGSAVTSVTIGGAATTALNLGTGMGAGDTINIGGAGSVTTIAGDLVVQGTTTSVDSEVVMMTDNHLYMNAGYTTAAAQTGGLVVNSLPTATATTVAATGFVAGVAAVSNPTVNTVGAATFAAGDLIQISGAGNVENDGLFEVLTHAANLLTIRGVGTTATLQDFTQNQFTTSAVVAGAITKVTVAVIRSGTDGIWEVAYGSTNGLTFSDLSTTAGTTLQTAYDNSSSPATITTNATDDEVLITGTAGLRVTGTGADNTVSAGFGFEVDTTGAYRLLADASSTLSVDSNNLTLSTTTSGNVQITSASQFLADATGTIELNSTGGTLNIGNDANAFGINIGTGAAARTITIGNVTTTTALVLNSGTGGVDINATGAGSITVDAGATGNFSIDALTSSNVTVTGAAQDLTLSSVGGSVIVQGTEAAADAVRIFASDAGGGIDADAGTAGITIDTTGVLSLGSVGASDWTNSTGTLTLATTTSGDLNVTSASSVVVTGQEAAVDAITLTASNAAGGIDINTGTGGATLDTTGSFSWDAATASNVSVSGATADLTFGARGSTAAITLNQAGDITLVGTFTATSIIGALNELKTGASTFSVSDFYTTTGRTVGEPVRATAGSRIATSATDATLLSTSEGFVGIVRVVGAAGTGQVVTQGRAVALFEAGIATPTEGEPIYLSETTGRVTNVAPSGNPASNKIVFQIGVMIDTTSASGGTGLTAGTVGAAETAAILLQPMQLFEL